VDRHNELLEEIMKGLKDRLPVLRLLILSLALSLVAPNLAVAQAEFKQGVCGQTIRSSVTLTQDLLACSGDGIIIGADGITLEADGRRIDGTGTRRHVGVACKTCRGVVIQHAFVSGFETGVSIQGGNDNRVQENYLHDNGTGVLLASTSNNVVTRNTIRSNALGVASTAPGNGIYHNILWGNQRQIEDGGGNDWAAAGLGNYWSNYWGKDDGSGGRPAGDFIGDTRLPHEGVDYAPLLNPTVAQRFGGLLCDDWWSLQCTLIWRGGWSPVDIKVTDPLGRIVSRNVNQLGKDGFYAEDSQVEPGSTLAQVMVGVCTKYHSGEGTYSFEATALAPLSYWMEWYPALDGTVPFRRSIRNVPMVKGETHRAELRLKAVEGRLTACAVAPIDVKPASAENTT